MLTFLLIVIGTFVSEDATCIATGLLIQRGQVGVTVGILGSTGGIYFGDLALWSIGRLFGRAALTWPLPPTASAGRAARPCSIGTRRMPNR